MVSVAHSPGTAAGSGITLQDNGEIQLAARATVGLGCYLCSCFCSLISQIFYDEYTYIIFKIRKNQNAGSKVKIARVGAWAEILRYIRMWVSIKSIFKPVPTQRRTGIHLGLCEYKK